MISAQFNMTNTMAIMTNWDQIVYFTILSITIYVMYHKYTCIEYSAVIAFLLICFPSIYLVTSRHLCIKRIFIQFLNFTFLTTKLSFFSQTWNYIKRFITNNAIHIGSISIACMSTCGRTIFRNRSLRNKFFFARCTFFRNFIRKCFSFTEDTTASITTSIISRFMTKRNNELFCANGTSFFNLFHSLILKEREIYV